MSEPSGSRFPTGHGGVAGPAAAPPAVTVLAVDDQQVFRDAVGDLIAATEGFEQVGIAASGREALALAAELHPDLVLVDVRMPEMDGIETTRRLVAQDPETVVILISLEAPTDLPASIASAGAATHLRKQDLSPRTLRALWSRYGEGHHRG